MKKISQINKFAWIVMAISFVFSVIGAGDTIIKVFVSKYYLNYCMNKSNPNCLVEKMMEIIGK